LLASRCIAREMVMPVGRYIAWVGISLVGLLFLADWYLPKPLPEAVGEEINKPVIRIASIQRAPERIVIDTSQPTIVPSPLVAADPVQAEPSPLQSYASALPPAIERDKQRRKVIKEPINKVAEHRPPARRVVLSRGKSATTAPSTKLSFIDLISAKLARNLFNRH
jgi:hypothetical protein